MHRFICMHPSANHILLTPLSGGHGFADIPESVGSFASADGTAYAVERATTGLSSYADDNDAQRTKERIKQVAQNGFWATTSACLTIREPLVFADESIRTAVAINAQVRFSIMSLVETADFLAHTSILKALYRFINKPNNVDPDFSVASKMPIEEGICLPITDLADNTWMMKVGARGQDPDCFHVTFYGCKTPERGLSFVSPQSLRRIAYWRERGSDELKSVAVEIGEVV